MKLISLDSSHYDESNGSNFISLGSIYVNIFMKFINDLYEYILTSINPRDIKLLPFDPS